MVNIDNFLVDLWTPLDNYASPKQLIMKDQKVPDDQLEKNRIIYGVILMTETWGRQTIISDLELVPFDDERWEDDEGFEHDIKKTNIFFPEGTLSFNAFGPEGEETLKKIQRWFYTPDIGNWWLRENWDCVIRNVGAINDRTVYLETDYEKRLGFDVNVQFKDTVTVYHRTIEEMEGNYKIYNIADEKVADEDFKTYKE